MSALATPTMRDNRVSGFVFCANVRKMMSCVQKNSAVILFITVILQLSLSFFTAAQAVELVKVGGTGAGLGAMKLLGSAFEKSHPDVKVQIVPDLGGAGGVLALLQGNLDVAISGSALNRDERISGITAVEYARTPFVFVVHKNVAKSALTVQELEQIYAGKIRTWPGGNLIRVVLRPENDTDSRIISSLSPSMGQTMKVARSLKGKIIALTDRESAEAVAATPGAIGTSTLTQIATEKLPLKVLAFDGAIPNLTSISTGSYRLYKPLYLVTTSRITPAARQFAEFVRSPAGDRILAQSGNLVIDEPATRKDPVPAQ